MRIDLHTHSTCSDGTLTPAELVLAAADTGLDVVALTDHDTVAGWSEALAAAPPGLTVVPGVEVSCASNGISLHLLAYHVDPHDDALAVELARTRDDRVPRAREIVRRLAADGYPVTWELVLAQVGAEGTVGRPHVADALVAADVVGSRDEAFDRLLHSRSPYAVRHYAADPVDMVRLVRAAGGVTVFAHPGAHARGRVVGDDVVRALAEAGLSGLEVDHPDHDPDTRRRLRALAADLGLLVTGASDFHGTGKVNRLGQECTEPDIYEALMARAVRTERA